MRLRFVHRPPAAFNTAWRRPNLSLCVCIAFAVCLAHPVSTQDHRLATFYGAYQRVKPSQSDTGLQIDLNFKSSAQNGLILAVRLDRGRTNAGYIAVGLLDRRLHTLVSGASNTVNGTSTASPLDTDTWYALSVVVTERNVAVDLRNEGGFHFSSSLPLSELLTVRDMFLGGANSFFSRAFTTLDMTEYFVGCLANCTINNRDIDFAPKLDGYGMEYGCCPNPEPVSWKFVAGHHNTLVFDSRLSHSRFQSNTLILSFLIKLDSDGMIFYSHDDQTIFALAVELVNTHIMIHLINTADIFNIYSMTCEGAIIYGWRHEIQIAVQEDQLVCVVDATETRMNVTRPRLPTDSLEYHVGSANVSSTSESAIHVFQLHLETEAMDGMFPSFGGSMQKLQLNGLEVSLSSLSLSTPILSPACPHANLPPVCQELRGEVSVDQLAEVSVTAVMVTLDEAGTVLLVEEDLELSLPDAISRVEIREAIRDSMEFVVSSPPRHGSLINMSDPDDQVVRFSYSHLQSHSIAYRHHGDEVPTDSFSVNVTSVCLPVVHQSISINFSIHLMNDFPVVTQSGTLSIAMGTRRVISPNVISVEDEESTSLINISFRVLSIFVDGCSMCVPAGRVEQTSTPGFNSTYFNQKDINSGDVSFQHFREFGAQPITIRLRASDSVGALVPIDIPVVPRVGRVNLVRNEPLNVVQGRCENINNDLLTADTDFNDQNPLLQYSVVRAPAHGRLEIQDQGFWRPILEPDADLPGFTQRSVNRRQVRYCHDNISMDTDSFEFQLHSTLLPADRANFTINIFAYDRLPRPVVTLATTSVQLPEGGQASLTEATLAVSLDESVSTPWSSEELSVDILGLFFTITTLPSFGNIFVNGNTESGFTFTQLTQGEVEYRHDNSENHEDFLSFRMEARNVENLPIQTPELPSLTNISINISPVNDHTPFIETSRITVGEGRFVIMDQQVLNITDSDQPTQNVTVTIIEHNVEFGFFAVSDTAVPLDQFTTADIGSGTIYFHHNFTSTLPLTQSVTLLASDGERSSQKEIVIEVQALEIDTSRVSQRDCVASLDATAESLSVSLLQEPFLAIEIRDDNGLDNNRLQNMVLQVTEQPLYGDLILGDALVSEFVLNDLDNEQVMYRFRNRTNIISADGVTIQVHYGHSEPADLILRICIDPVPVPDLESAVINPISLAPNASVVISNETFNTVDSRGRGGEEIIYLIVHSPQWGRVVDQTSRVLNNFTQAQVDNSQVFYHHDNLSSHKLKDYFIIQLCTRYVCQGKYNITVTFSVTNLTVYNNGMRVVEGSEAYINKDHLDAIAPEGRVIFHILKYPSWGTLHIIAGGLEYPPQFFDTQDIASESVLYRHSGTEASLKDSFTFRATTNGGQEQVSDVFHITVEPVNDNSPSLLRNGFSMIARTTWNITSDDLFAYDGDSNVDSHSLVYQVIFPPIYGYVHYRNNTQSTSSLQRWTERDVRENRLAYTHTDQDRLEHEIREVIVVKLSDRDQAITSFIEILISEIQLDIMQSGVTVSEGEEGVINSENLNAVSIGDDSITPTDLKYQLTALPRNGRIMLNGIAVTNFTQADLLGVGLVYRHDHTNTISDSFNYTVTISRHDAREMGTFKITILPVDDDPPTLNFRHQPFFVLEGDEISIISQYLEVIDLDTDMNLATQTAEIKFEIISQPMHGDVWRRQGVASKKFRVTEVFTLYEVIHRSVKYVSHPVDHTRADLNWADWFLVNLTDGDNTNETPYNFTFVILPNVVSVQTSPFHVAEGEHMVVPNNTITVLHPYLSTQQGCILITEQPRNGTFANLATGEDGLTNFTTADLKAGLIEYRHNDAEKEKDRVKFTYKAHQPTAQPTGFAEILMRTSGVVNLNILIDTVNDRGPEIRHHGMDSSLVMWAGDCAFLSTYHLDVFDADTPNNKLTYTFNFSSIDAYISHINESNTIEIQSFTQEDVVNNLIKLFHRSGSNGTMHYTVTDGEYSISGQLPIETHQLEIVVLRNNPLTVPMNGMVAITPEALHVGTSDANTTISRCFFNEAVEYQFEAKYGVINVNGVTNVTSFTDDDVKKGRVYYQHTRPDIWESLETLGLRAKAILTGYKEFSLNITIILPSEPDSPLAVHKTLSVVEGGSVCLNESILDARNIHYNATKAFNKTLTTWFLFHTADSHGEILLNEHRLAGDPLNVTQDQIASESVCYQNSGDESTHDSLIFSVVIKDSEMYVWDSFLGLVLEVSVTLINDEAPVVVSSTLMVSVVEGFSALITNNSLLVVDEDNPASDLFFTIISAPSGGHLWLNGERRLLENDEFAQEIVDNGRLAFEALDIGEWTALLSFTDGTFKNFTNFTVMVEEQFLKVQETRVLTYSQNEKGVHLTAKHIIVQTNGDLNDTVYNVVEGPINGKLKGLRKDGFFTHADLLAENITYVPTNFGEHTDFFKVDVTNREAQNSTVTINIRVEVWGQVKQNSELNFNSASDGDPSLPLPSNILSLADLQILLKRPPLIVVVQPPKFGYLEVRVSTPLKSSRTQRSVKPPAKFTYNFLDQNWVYYTWNSSSGITVENPDKGVNDSFSILVEGYESVQPGEATITLHIRNPPMTSETPPSPTEPPSPDESPVTLASFADDTGSGGFPNYAFLIITGIFLALVAAIVVVIVFYRTQQGRIRKRLQPKLFARHPNTLSGPGGQNFQLHSSSNMYDFDPTNAPHVEAMTSLNEVTEFRDGRSPILSHSPMAQYSPLAAHHPPSMAHFPPLSTTDAGRQSYHHHRHFIPRPRSRRSNVSVSYSQRPLSEVTLDEELPRPRHQTFSPLLASGYSMHNPLRPATGCSSTYDEGEGESGYLSTPNPSIAPGDEPVRLVLRRPIEVQPLPRDVDTNPEEQQPHERDRDGEDISSVAAEEAPGEREDTLPENMPPQQLQLADDHEEDEPARSPSPARSITANSPAPPLEDTTTFQNPPDNSESVAHSSNGAHAVAIPTPPPLDHHLESEVADSIINSANNIHTTSPSELHSVFRTHNPILKQTEYWV